MENRIVRILLAEDDENLGVLLKEYLQAKDFEVDLYKDGEKAYRGFQNKYYDICVLDVMMPDVTGLDVLRFMRNQPALAKIPVIVVSAKSMPSDIRTGLEAGASIYLTKPVAFLELKKAVEDTIRKPSKT